MFRILIAEDDKETRRLMEDTLADAGYEPISAADGQEALELLTRTHVDLLILDVMMPRLDGFALLAALRRSGSQLPVLLLTAKEALADKKQGLRLGADDYMTKPADEEEMLLRIQALLRRAQAISSRRLTVGGTTLVYDDLAVEWSGTVTDLPRKEFQLLYKLLSCPDKTFTRRQLMDEIWDLATDSDEHTANVHINIFSHEFKTPIVSIRGFARRLRRGGLTREQQAEYLDFIVEESERLSKLASNVLLISRYENQKLVAEQIDYDLDEQIRTSVLRLESQWGPPRFDLRAGPAPSALP